MEEKKHNWWKILLLGLLSFLLLIGGFSAAVSIMGEERYNDVVAFIDNHLGLPGIFLYVYIVDMLILPSLLIWRWKAAFPYSGSKAPHWKGL